MTTPIKILIIEDSDLIKTRLEESMSALNGAEIVGFADNSFDAIEKYIEFQPNIMILDLMLKSGTGFEVLESIKYRPESNIVIVFTNHPDNFIKQSCLDSGSDFFLDKSNDFERLVSICKNIISERLVAPILPIKKIALNHSSRFCF